MQLKRLTNQAAVPARLLSRKGTWCLVAVCFLVLPIYSTTARKIVGPPNRSEVASTWVGFSEDELYLFRLVLSLSDDSLIGFAFANDEPKVYPVSSWRYQNGRIEIDAVFEPGYEDWDGPLKGTVSVRAMTLRMRGKGWSRSISLRPEPELESRWLRLREGMLQQGK